jgi:hypothetical protein
MPFHVQMSWVEFAQSHKVMLRTSSWRRYNGCAVPQQRERCKVRAISIILFGKPFTFEEELEHIDVKRLHEFRKKS